MKNISIKAIDDLRKATKNGCRFMSFLYLTKGTEEMSRYTINFGITYENACASDKLAIEAYVPQNDLEVEAKAQMLQSLHETLTEGVSASYTQKDTFDHIGKGIRQHRETGEIYIYGFVESKSVEVPAKNPKKPVNSRPLTLAKEAIKKACDLKRNKFGQFILSPDHIAGVVVNDKVVKLVPAGSKD